MKTKIKERLFNKQGNIALYMVIGAIIIGAIVIIGIAFSDNIKGSLFKSFSNQNAGFDYYSSNIAADDVP